MRANLSDELMNAIEERIYLDIERHVLESKLHKAEQEGNEGFAKHINKLITEIIRKRKETNDYLKQNGIKIFDVVEVDDLFVEYPYSQSIKGGYKEGVMKFWRSAIKFKLKRRMSKYFGGE